MPLYWEKSRLHRNSFHSTRIDWDLALGRNDNLSVHNSVEWSCPSAASFCSVPVLALHSGDDDTITEFQERVSECDTYLGMPPGWFIVFGPYDDRDIFFLHPARVRFGSVLMDGQELADCCGWEGDAMAQIYFSHFLLDKIQSSRNELYRPLWRYRDTHVCVHNLY